MPQPGGNRPGIAPGIASGKIDRLAATLKIMKLGGTPRICFGIRIADGNLAAGPLVALNHSSFFPLWFRAVSCAFVEGALT
jgi:hypothetical protein